MAPVSRYSILMEGAMGGAVACAPAAGTWDVAAVSDRKAPMVVLISYSYLG